MKNIVFIFGCAILLVTNIFLFPLYPIASVVAIVVILSTAFILNKDEEENKMYILAFCILFAVSTWKPIMCKLDNRCLYVIANDNFDTSFYSKEEFTRTNFERLMISEHEFERMSIKERIQQAQLYAYYISIDKETFPSRIGLDIFKGSSKFYSNDNIIILNVMDLVKESSPDDLFMDISYAIEKKTILAKKKSIKGLTEKEQIKTKFLEIASLDADDISHESILKSLALFKEELKFVSFYR